MKARRALYDEYGLFTAKNTAGVTPLISHFAGTEYGSFFLNKDLARERAASVR